MVSVCFTVRVTSSSPSVRTICCLNYMSIPIASHMHSTVFVFCLLAFNFDCLGGIRCAVAGMRVAPHKFISLNTWSTVSETVWKGQGVWPS